MVSIRPRPRLGGFRAQAQLLILSASLGLLWDTAAAQSRWTQIEGDRAQARFGFVVATAGDVDPSATSHFDDVIVGARDYDNKGAVFLYLGSAAGLSTTPAAMAIGNFHSEFGAAVATAGDVNRDGRCDVIVGAPSENAVYLYEYASGSLNLLHRFSGAQKSRFGTSVVSGDFDNDEKPDIVIGAPGDETSEGHVFLYSGADFTQPPIDLKLAQQGQGARFGSQVSVAGDFDSNGLVDLLISAEHYTNPERWEGAAFLYLNRGNAPWTILPVEANQRDAELGSVAGAGDLNGDHVPDIAVGIQKFGANNSRFGEVRVYFGQQGRASLNTPDLSVLSSEFQAELGFAVASAGDVDGDCKDDLLINVKNRNRVDKWSLSSGQWAGSALPNQLEGNTHGNSIASAGDVNGDGFSDLVMGVPGFGVAPLKLRGAVVVYYGEGPSAWPKCPVKYSCSSLPCRYSVDNQPLMLSWRGGCLPIVASVTGPSSCPFSASLKNATCDFTLQSIDRTKTVTVCAPTSSSNQVCCNALEFPSGATAEVCQSPMDPCEWKVSPETLNLTAQQDCSAIETELVSGASGGRHLWWPCLLEVHIGTRVQSGLGPSWFSECGFWTQYMDDNSAVICKDANRLHPCCEPATVGSPNSSHVSQIEVCWEGEKPSMCLFEIDKTEIVVPLLGAPISIKLDPVLARGDCKCAVKGDLPNGIVPLGPRSTTGGPLMFMVEKSLTPQTLLIELDCGFTVTVNQIKDSFGDASICHEECHCLFRRVDPDEPAQRWCWPRDCECKCLRRHGRNCP